MNCGMVGVRKEDAVVCDMVGLRKENELKLSGETSKFYFYF